MTDQLLQADEIHQMAFEEGQPAENGDGYLFTCEEFELFVERLLTRAQPADCEQKPVESPTAWEMVALDKDGEVYRYALRKEQTTNRDALYCWGGTVAEQFKIEHRPLFTHPAPVTLLQWVENDRYCPHCNVEIDELEGTASSAPAGVVLPEYKNRRDQYGYLYPDDRIWNACREETARLNGIKP